MRRYKVIFILIVISLPLVNWFISNIDRIINRVTIVDLSSPFKDLWISQHTHLTAEDVEKLQENRCKIPILDPFEEELANFFSPFEVDCSNQDRDFYFKSFIDTKQGYESFIIRTKELPEDMRCCYKNIEFEERHNYSLVKEKTNRHRCTKITSNETRVPSDYQFVVIYCNLNSPQNGHSSFFQNFYNSKVKTEKELLLFVPKPKDKLLNKKKKLLQKRKLKRHPKLNVIILGFDTVSRLNFIRQMRKSFEYLKNELEAIDLQGFNKIGDATLNNTLALLAGVDFGTVLRNGAWWNSSTASFDALPWIWKNFSKNGYITSMGDDYVSVFDYRFNGFSRKPTDYYLHPFVQWFDIRSEQFSSDPYCVGNEPFIHLLQDYARKTSMALQDHPYFQFLWSSAIHEKPGYPSVVDDGLLQTLKFFNETNVLNKSLIILVSDHGWRAGNIMRNEQARIENKMNFAFLLLPKWFRSLYPKAYENLYENQHRLTTPYDLHSTMLNILRPGKYSKGRVYRTERPFKLKGSSLFLPISKNRTCEMAGIDEVWCACAEYRHFSLYDEAEKLANFAVETINSWLKPFKSCKQYELGQVLSAEVKITLESFSAGKEIDLKGENTFKLVFEVADMINPATFEVVVFTKSGWFINANNANANEFMKMSTEVFRISNYGNSCIEIYSLKKICTC